MVLQWFSNFSLWESLQINKNYWSYILNQINSIRIYFRYFLLNLNFLIFKIWYFEMKFIEISELYLCMSFFFKLLLCVNIKYKKKCGVKLIFYIYIYILIYAFFPWFFFPIILTFSFSFLIVDGIHDSVRDKLIINWIISPIL